MLPPFRPFACRLIGAALFLFLSLPFTVCWAEQRAAKDGLIDALRIDAPVLLCGERVPLEDRGIVERFEKEMLVSLGNRPQVILWLKRTTRYFPFIEQALQEKHLPEDLKYLAVAESALRVHAGSPKGALGIWQLMPPTARKYGLKVDDEVDERRSFFLSTSAAVSYLIDLFDRFGSWSLSLAAYNMGEEGLEAEILEQGHTDYYRLYLPLETQRFVFRILAIKRILETPHAHGFILLPSDYYAPEKFASVQIHAVSDLPLRLVAAASGTDFKAIKDLNPELRGHYLAAGTRIVNIPTEGAAGFTDRLGAMIDADTKMQRRRIYVVKPGDSLSGIAQKFEVPLAALLIWNRIGVNSIIHPGQRLVVVPGMTGGAPSDRTEFLENTDG